MNVILDLIEDPGKKILPPGYQEKLRRKSSKFFIGSGMTAK
jgi:hypothetical protein